LIALITAIREVRRAKGLTLDDVAQRCVPPTTAQTIGRLETGMRTVSVGWLNRIAAALGVAAAELVKLPEQTEVPVAALLGADGVHAPSHAMTLPVPRPIAGAIGIRVNAGIGDYRAGDVIWCERLATDAYGSALNRDVLVPRPGGRFLFGRLIGRDPGKLQILPLTNGGRQQVIPDPAWLGLATRLVRPLG
jgi:transcriptional regulator with XRE-family HTH domain